MEWAQLRISLFVIVLVTTVGFIPSKVPTAEAEAQMFLLPSCNIPSDCPKGLCGGRLPYCVDHLCRCNEPPVNLKAGFGQPKVPTAEAVSWPYCKMDRDCTGWCGKAPAYCVNQVCQCFPPKTAEAEAQMWQLPNCNIPSDCPKGWCGRSGTYCVNHRCQCHPSKKFAPLDVNKDSASEEQAIP